MINHLKFTLLPILAILFGLMLLNCGGKKTFSNLTARQLYQKGIELYEKEKYTEAVEYFQLIVYNHPGEAIVDTAQYYLALSYFGNKEYPLAQVEFNRLIVNYPSSVYVVNAQFMKAVCYFEGAPRNYGLDQTDLFEAIKLFEDFIIDHPESDLAADARKYSLLARTRLAHKYYENGIVYMRINAFTAAKKYFQIVIDDYTDTEYAPKAAFHIAETELHLKNYEEAIRQFDNFTLVFPDHEWSDKAVKKRIEATFKVGEMKFEKGEFTTARELFDEYVKRCPETDNLKYQKAFFMSAEASYLEKDYSLARDKFQSYINDFPKNSRTRKAEKYLEEIEKIITRETVNYVPDES